MLEKPYLEETIRTVIRKYNPRFGDDRMCECGHPYCRHFDDMKAAECRYCGCAEFIEDTRRLSPHDQQQPIVVKVPVAAEMLGMCVKTLYGLMNRGEIAYVKYGKMRRVEVQSMKEWAERNRKTE